MLILQGLLNCFNSLVLAWINAFSVVWHVPGVVVLIILLPAVAPTHQSGSYVFGQFNGWQTVTSGITNNGCGWLLHPLLKQGQDLAGWTFTPHLTMVCACARAGTCS